MVRVVVHRGTHQIGGCATEISTERSRIIIDMGAELEPVDSGRRQLSIEGVTCGKANCDAVLFSHYHSDHVGEMENILPEVPLWFGAASKELLTLYWKRVKNAYIKRLEKANTFVAGQPVQIGAFRVTAFVVDHSAFDSYMFLIEAEGKKILHMGDFRAHGFKGKGLEKVLRHYVGKVDLLITEGTNLSRNDAGTISERELQQKAAELLIKHKYLFVVCASTNIDRIAAFYNATPRGKYFLCDEYQKDILRVAERYGAVHTGLYSFPKALVYGENLVPKLHNRGFCMLVRGAGVLESMLEQFWTEESHVIYSMWQGYLSEPTNTLNKVLGTATWEYLHTSGHATKQTIREVCLLVKPRQGVVVIHRDVNSTNLGDIPTIPILGLQDGQVLEVH